MIIEYIQKKRAQGYGVTLDVSELGWLLSVWEKPDKMGMERMIESHMANNQGELDSLLEE